MGTEGKIYKSGIAQGFREILLQSHCIENKSRLIYAFILLSAFKILTIRLDVIGPNDVIIITKQFN